MVEIKTMLNNQAIVSKLNVPKEVKDKIVEVLEVIDESYGVGDQRALEGGKVILVENQQDVEQLHNQYDLSCNEFVEDIRTEQGVYLYILIIWGTENNICIIGRQEFLISVL